MLYQVKLNAEQSFKNKWISNFCKSGQKLSQYIPQPEQVLKDFKRLQPDQVLKIYKMKGDVKTEIEFDRDAIREDPNKLFELLAPNNENMRRYLQTECHQGGLMHLAASIMKSCSLSESLIASTQNEIISFTLNEDGSLDFESTIEMGPSKVPSTGEIIGEDVIGACKASVHLSTSGDSMVIMPEVELTIHDLIGFRRAYKGFGLSGLRINPLPGKKKYDDHHIYVDLINRNHKVWKHFGRGVFDESNAPVIEKLKALLQSIVESNDDENLAYLLEDDKILQLLSREDEVIPLAEILHEDSIFKSQLFKKAFFKNNPALIQLLENQGFTFLPEDAMAVKQFVFDEGFSNQIDSRVKVMAHDQVAASLALALQQDNNLAHFFSCLDEYHDDNIAIASRFFEIIANNDYTPQRPDWWTDKKYESLLLTFASKCLQNRDKNALTFIMQELTWMTEQYAGSWNYVNAKHTANSIAGKILGGFKQTIGDSRAPNELAEIFSLFLLQSSQDTRNGYSILGKTPSKSIRMIENLIHDIEQKEKNTPAEVHFLQLMKPNLLLLKGKTPKQPVPELHEDDFVMVEEESSYTDTDSLEETSFSEKNSLDDSPKSPRLESQDSVKKRNNRK